jgi:hypothetical protein
MNLVESMITIKMSFTESTFGARKLSCLLIKSAAPALKPFSATIKALPTTTINIVSADLAFLSLKASKDSMKICSRFLCFFLFLLIVETEMLSLVTVSKTHYLSLFVY